MVDKVDQVELNKIDVHQVELEIQVVQDKDQVVILVTAEQVDY